MDCPKCGTQNPDNAKICAFCGSDLTQLPESSESVKVKTSRIAIASLILGILSFITCGITAIPALILGIVGLVKIEKSGGKLTGRGFAVIGIVSPVIALFVIFVLNYLVDISTKIHPKMVCASNLSGIGRAMLLYNSDFGDLRFQEAGGPGTIWQPKINNWQADNRIDAFGLHPDGTGGSATISSSFYLLVKYYEVSPKSFCCPADPKTRPFKASDYKSGMDDEDAWDFGPEPTKHYSYSYHLPYGQYALLDTFDPDVAVAADRNPWLDPFTDTTGFKWDSQTMSRRRQNIKRYMKGNSGLHKREGQNVLFLANHVYFEKRSFCAFDDDNIYTYWNGSDIRQGAPPTLKSQPADKLDSLLVNEPPKRNQK